MTLSQLRRQLNSLRRKFAVQITVYRLRRHCDQYCEEWRETVEKDPHNPPEASTLFRRLPGSDSLLKLYPHVYNFLTHCRFDRSLPTPTIFSPCWYRRQ